jgi:hypothetical protein
MIIIQRFFQPVSERQPRDLMKPDLNLNTKDIQGAQSWTTTFAKTYRARAMQLLFGSLFAVP